MFILPALPYAYDGLEPVVSQTTMRTHHDKHHKAYVDTVNKLVAERRLEPQSLEALIASAEKGKLSNNAGQAWNHAFFWECMSPDAAAPDRIFTSLRDDFIEQGATHFGSGWVWIAAKGAELSVLTTHDGDTLAHHSDLTPILVCDLWEHAYYLDHKNDRKGFLTQWFDGLADWRFAEAQLSAAQGQGAPYRYPAPRTERQAIAKDAQAAPRPA